MRSSSSSSTSCSSPTTSSSNTSIEVVVVLVLVLVLVVVVVVVVVVAVLLLYENTNSNEKSITYHKIFEKFQEQSVGLPGYPRDFPGAQCILSKIIDFCSLIVICFMIFLGFSLLVS